MENVFTLQVYFTGISENSGPIPVEYGPEWIQVHGGGCVACHGTEGKGGILFGKVASADIRYKSLTSEDHRHGMGNDHHSKCTDELIKRAVTRGLNSAGKPLDRMMPRFRMSDSDLDDLIEYLKTLKL